ncbi:MAG TPA: hypothetical protein VNI54_03280 [Thermoanaerobaculia bacterium]|nr:hypothetical protein [Thermoanaerobaculia bacterium]
MRLVVSFLSVLLLALPLSAATFQSVLKFNANLESRFTEEDRAKIKEWSDPERVKADRRKAVLELTLAKTPAYFADRAKAKPFMDALNEGCRLSVVWGAPR